MDRTNPARFPNKAARTAAFLLCLMASGCATQNFTAPIIDIRTGQQIPGLYEIKPGETLSSIAWKLDLDPEKLAQQNRLVPPYVIIAGKQLEIYADDPRWEFPHRMGRKATRPEVMPDWAIASATKAKKVVKEVLHKAVKPRAAKRTKKGKVKQDWIRPAAGKIGATFDAKEGGHKGIDILGTKGFPVIASAAGTVVYVGNGMPQYGNLVIVRHGEDYMTAYGHLDSFAVKEGDSLEQGDTIGRMGDSASRKVKLHFEIRRKGKAIDPVGLIDQ